MNNKKNNLSHLKNIIFIHDKYNSYENINNLNPQTQRENPHVKEKFNHKFYYDNNSYDAESSFYPKKITSPRLIGNRQGALKKIFFNNKPEKISNHKYSNITQSKRINSNDIKAHVKKEYPKNYSYYERKETSNNKKFPNNLLKNKNPNKNLVFNNTNLKNRISSSDRYNQTNNKDINPLNLNNYLNNKPNINLNSCSKDNKKKKIIESENYYQIIRSRSNSSKGVNDSFSTITIFQNDSINIKPKKKFLAIPQKEIAFTYCKTDNIPLGEKNYSTKNIYGNQQKEKIHFKNNYLSPKITLKKINDNSLPVYIANNKSRTETKMIQINNKFESKKLNIRNDLKNNNNFEIFGPKSNITTRNDTNIHSKINTKTETKENTINNKKLDKKNKNLFKTQKKLVKTNKLNNNNPHIQIYNKNDIQLTSITNINNSITPKKLNFFNDLNNEKELYTTYSPNKISIKINPNNKKLKQKTTHRLSISSHKQTNERKYNNNSAIKISENNNIIYDTLKNNSFEQEWDSEKFMGKRKKTYDIKRKNKQYSSQTKNSNSNTYDNNIKMYFVPNIYIKDIKAATQAGREESHFTKTNQDTYLIEKNINGILNYNLFGVFDGHGPYGHFASQFVSKYILSKLKNHPKLKFLEQPSDIYHKIKEKNFKLIEEIFINCDKQIQKEKFNSYLSGTTVVIVIQIEENLICANCGDSRAIMIIDEDYNNNLINSKIIPLSIDCKPNLLEEKKRILKKGGIVEKSENEFGEGIGPYRVWDGDNDYPGLAMSRSIGDLAAKKVGVIPNPLIMEYIIDYYSKYLIICSDGVWEFLSNKDVMDIGNEYYLRNDASGLCEKIIKKATQCWEEEDIVVDDITVIAVFF